MSAATLWAPACPICGAESDRDPQQPVIDCTCRACGWFFTSEFRGAVLKALCWVPERTAKP
jgi:hypothetical protein